MSKDHISLRGTHHKDVEKQVLWIIRQQAEQTSALLEIARAMRRIINEMELTHTTQKQLDADFMALEGAIALLETKLHYVASGRTLF